MGEVRTDFPRGPEFRDYVGRGYGFVATAGALLLFVPLCLIPRIGVPLGFVAAASAVAMGYRGLTTRFNATIRPPQPRPSKRRGTIRLIDASDGRGAFEDRLAMFSWLWAAAWMAGLIGAGMAVLLAAHVTGPTGPDDATKIEIAWIVAACVLSVLAILAVRRPWLVMRLSGAGIFDVPAWPLAPGSRVPFSFRRRLAPKLSLEACTAQLELVWIRGGAPGSHALWTLESQPLAGGNARRTKSGIAAEWEFEAPPAPDPVALLKRFSNLPTWGYPQWRIRVALQVAGLPDRDSELWLALTPPSV
ncbi:MAG TPA: hypothetical protein V6D47_00085 [Oscillatoriaceae cyanobacterium]